MRRKPVGGLTKPITNPLQNETKNEVEAVKAQTFIEVEQAPLAAENPLGSASNPLLYQRGAPSDCFYLILNGRVSICSGKEGFQMERGIFHYMGEQCIT